MPRLGLGCPGPFLSDPGRRHGHLRRGLSSTTTAFVTLSCCLALSWDVPAGVTQEARNRPLRHSDRKGAKRSVVEESPCEQAADPSSIQQPLIVNVRSSY